MAECGFGTVVVNDVWDAKYPFGTDLEGRFLYVRERDEQWLLAAFDFSYMFRRTSLAWREAISSATGIPVPHIWVHELQNHSAPCALELDGKPCERLVDVSLPVIRKVIASAEETELAYVIVDLGDRFSMNREQYIPGLGAVTVWAGCEFDEDGRPYTSNPCMLLEPWKPKLPVLEKPTYFDRPADPQAALLVFRNRAGKVLGTLARFAAHADIVGACATNGCGDTTEYHYHFDWPGYLRQTVDSELGGTGVCVCGPCGNLSTKKRLLAGYEAGDRQAREIGSGVAKACLDAWGQRSPEWEPLRLGTPVHARVDLPMRETLPRDREELKTAGKRADEHKQTFQKAIQAGECPAHIRQLIDEFQHLGWVPLIVDRWVGLSDQEMRDRVLSVELEAVRLNDLVLAGLPGESLTETCQWLRAQSLGNRLIVLDQVNGYCAYQTTREQYDLGGYSYACSCLAREAGPLTGQYALELIRSLC